MMLKLFCPWRVNDVKMFALAVNEFSAEGLATHIQPRISASRIPTTPTKLHVEKP